MNLHKEFYALRDLIWQEFEKLVQEGCKIDGELPIIVGEYSLPANGLRTGGVHLTDTTNINIIGIRSDDEYAIFPKKENEKDINVTTNRIKVIVKKYEPKDEKFYTFEIDVEPDILDLQSLSTYVSGGFKAYEK